MPSSRFQDFLSRIAQATVAVVEGFRQRTLAWFVSEAMVVRNAMNQTNEKFTAKDVLDEGFLGLGSENLKFELGRMVLFRYDPKWKKELPYYDIYPLIFPVQWYPDGFLGINMHYLPPPYRAILMDALYPLLSVKPNDAGQEKLQVTYQILANSMKYQAYKPCVKRYLWKHVRSNLSVIPIERWEMVLMLPLARFQKASEAKVWRDSLAIINNRKRS